MTSLVKLLIALAVLSFVAAVVVAWTGPVLEIPAEGFSRASSNLSLIAIALVVSERAAVTA